MDVVVALVDVVIVVVDVPLALVAILRPESVQGWMVRMVERRRGGTERRERAKERDLALVTSVKFRKAIRIIGITLGIHVLLSLSRLL